MVDHEHIALADSWIDLAIGDDELDHLCYRRGVKQDCLAHRNDLAVGAEYAGVVIGGLVDQR